MNLLLIIPVVSLFYLMKNQDKIIIRKLDSTEFEHLQSIEALHDHLDIRKTSAVWFQFIFCVRRLVISLVLIYYEEPGI